MRVFDEAKAREFYCDFMGMTVDWEHRFEPNLPLYMQVSYNDMVLHLSEHSGDGRPGIKILINTDSLDTLYSDITSRPYRYSRPKIELAAWGDRMFEVTDPFSNRLIFNEI
ncbi:glyoxalase superfamily protein [Temperatibacter marinus]|uniref:Bleomycin resistance protein n=1 Tax=Temperatibacter marinus TaxID=1456591 RepID=A0AA52EJX6_9PROT|nr:glyoxalase superfamily protein [Temperatibacter marinus]WND04165.1 glyoxalase superfamily protein [Temperatibacter marinus]